MICPFCQAIVIEGEDVCQECSQPLTEVLSTDSQKTRVEQNLESRSLSLLNPVEPVSVSPTTPVRDVIKLLGEKNIGCVLVVWCDALVGIFSERDALMKIGHRFEKLANEPIRHFMTPTPETLSDQDSIAFALNRMAVGDFRHVPIEQDENPVGIVSVRDVLRYVTKQFPEILTKTAT